MDNNLNTLIHKFRLREKNNTFFGEISRVKLILIKENKSEINIQVPVNFSSSKTPLYEYLDKLSSAKTIVSHEFTDENFFIKFNYDAPATEITSSISELVKIINNLEHKETCAGCKKGPFTEFYSFNEEVMNLCTNCKIKYEKEIEESRKTKSNYITGLLGALIGGLLGSIIWIAIGYFGFFASIAGVAIAFAAFYGYTLFNPKQTIPGVIIVVCSIVFSVLFAEYMGIFLQFLKEIPGYTFKQYFLEFPYYLTDAEFIWSILPNLGLGFLFSGLGASKTISKNLNEAKNLKNLKIERI